MHTIGNITGGWPLKCAACAALLMLAMAAGGCITRAQTADKLLANIKTYDSQGDYAKAVQTADQLIKTLGAANDEPTRLKAAEAYFWRGYSNDLWKDRLRGGRRISPDVTKYRDAAIKDYEAAIKMDPGFVEAYFNLGLLYYDESDFEKAMTYFTKVAEISPETPQARAYIASIYAQQGRYDEAADAIEKLLAGSAEAAIRESRRLRGLGRIDEAIDTLEKAVSLYPNFALGHKELGFLYLFHRGDSARALHQLEIYAKSLPDGDEKTGIEKIIEKLKGYSAP